MISRIKALFQAAAPRDTRSAPAAAEPAADKALAAAALMVAAAHHDGSFDESERQTIRRLLAERFALSPDEVEELLASAQAAHDGSSQLVYFTRAVKDSYAPEDRVEIIELLWEVAYADGVVHAYEANLVGRVAGLIYVSDRERGDARKRVAARHTGAADSSA